MAMGMFVFSAVDTQAKYLTETIHPLQIVWIRQLGLLTCALVLFGIRGKALFATKNPGVQITRGVLAAGSASLFIIAVRFIPLADAVALSFVAPFLVTVIGAVVLKEPVGIRRWIAVGLGFFGTLIVIRPGLGVMHPAAFLVIIAATLFALRQIASRVLSGTDRTGTTVAYTAVVGSAILTLPLPFVWVWPETRTEIILLITMALMAGLGEILVIRALEVSMAVVVAPVQYTLILWGTLYGFFVFGQLPDFWTWVGAAIIVATGLYTLNRERIVARQRSGKDST